MWRLSEAELYCVNTNIRRRSELMQFEMATSTRRYFPPSGTAGLERCCVRGKRRVPAPPPRITASSLRLAGMLDHQFLDLEFSWQDRRKTARQSRNGSRKAIFHFLFVLAKEPGEKYAQSGRRACPRLSCTRIYSHHS